MDERRRLESTIEEAGAELREKRRQELLTRDPIERRRLRTEIEELQRRLFEFKKQFDAMTLTPTPESGERNEPQGPAKEDQPAPGPRDRTKVFISYSHKDRKWFERLLPHLQPLMSEGRVDFWDETQIQPGQRWREEIEKSIASARIAVLLVSADFLASDFISEAELPLLLEHARKGGMLLLPIILSPCRFQRTSLAEFSTMNSPSSPLVSKSKAEQDKIFGDVAGVIARYLPDAAPTS